MTNVTDAKPFNNGRVGYWMAFDLTDTTAIARGVIFGKSIEEMERNSTLFVSQQKIRIINPKIAVKNADFDPEKKYLLDIEIHIQSHTKVTTSKKRLKIDDLV